MVQSETKIKSTVKDYMTKNVITVTPNTSSEDVINLMKKTGHDGFPVVNENGAIKGIVTAYDVLLKDWAELVKE
jgi:CBS domain-containing protein